MNRLERGRRLRVGRGLVSGGVFAATSGERPNWGAIAAQSFGSALGNATVEDMAAQDSQATSSRRPVSQAPAAEDTPPVKISSPDVPPSINGNVADNFHREGSPAPAEPQRYTIQKGDTYTKIARRLGMSAAELALANPGISQFGLQIGQELTIPTAGSYSGADIASAGKTLDKQNAQRLATQERKQAQVAMQKERMREQAASQATVCAPNDPLLPRGNTSTNMAAALGIHPEKFVSRGLFVTETSALRQMSAGDIARERRLAGAPSVGVWDGVERTSALDTLNRKLDMSAGSC